MFEVETNPHGGHGVLEPAHTICRLALTTTSTDESLARVMSLLRRKLWSVLELHHRREPCHDRVELTAYKTDGRAELLVAALQREVVVIDVVPARP